MCYTQLAGHPPRLIIMIVRFLRTQRFTIAILLLGFFLFILSDLKWGLSASYIGRLLGYYKDIGTDFQVQIFSRDPLIVYIDNFVSQDEIDHLLNIRYNISLLPYDLGTIYTCLSIIDIDFN